MNKTQEESLKEERNKLEDEIEKAEDVWETTETSIGEVLPGLTDEQKKAVIYKIERVDYIDDWLRTGVKPSKLKGRMFYPHEINKLIKESYIGIKELREERLEAEYIAKKEKEGVTRAQKTEGRKLTFAIKALKEEKWKLFLTQFAKITHPESLSEKNRDKHKRIKAAIGKGMTLKQIVEIAEQTPGKFRAQKVKRQKVPEWKALSPEEHEEAMKKERGKLQYQLKGIKGWDVLFGIIIFIPVLLFSLFILFTLLRHKEQPLPEAPTGVGHISSFQSEGKRQ